MSQNETCPIIGHFGLSQKWTFSEVWKLTQGNGIWPGGAMSVCTLAPYKLALDELAPILSIMAIGFHMPRRLALSWLGYWLFRLTLMVLASWLL